MPLRYYQQECVDAVDFALEEFDRVLVNTATASGKTVMAAHLIKGWFPKRCIFIADQGELCTQPMTVIDREAHIIPALEKSESRASLSAKVVVASAQTLERRARLERFPEKFFDYALVDEAHRGADRDMVITKYLAKKVVGITATAFKSNLRDLSKYYDEVAYSFPLMDMIREGFAPILKALTLPVEIDLSGVALTKGVESDYDAESLSCTIEPYYRRIVELIVENAKNRKIIAFLPMIKSSEAFAHIARAHGISAMHVDGKSADRADIIESFRRGRFQMLCNSNLVATGVDIPIADCLVNLSATRSAVEYQQRVGRISRVLPGIVDDIAGRDQAAERRAAIAASAKPDSLILDFLWQNAKLGVVRPGSLVAVNDDDAKAIFERVSKAKTPEDLMRIAKLVQEEREALVVKRLEQVASRNGSLIEPAAFGYMVGSESLMQYEPVAKWEMDKPTNAQISALRNWGVDVDKIESKGLAKKIMDTFIFRSRYKLAHFRQLQSLKALKVEHDPRTITATAALHLITQAKLEATRK